MTKHLRLFLTMLVLTLLGSSAAWAGSVDITPSQALNDGGVDPITVTCAKGDGSSNPQISSGQLRLYQAGKGNTTGNTITFSSENTITKIVFTFANGMTADNGVFSEGDYDSSTSTWTGSTNSVTLTVTGTTTGQRIYITAMTVTYEGGGTVIQTVATPTFSPEGGDFTEAQDVTINCSTSGATIYYTTDGMAPTTSSSVYSSAISVEETTTIKAIAVKDGMNNSAVASATYTIITGGEGDSYDIDFENIAAYYTNWTFTNIVGKETNANVTAHGGSYFGSTNGKASGSIQTKKKIATPNSLTCYVSKQSTNTSASTWYIQVSSDGETWTDVATTSATDMARGEWKEFSADLSAYTDVYVRVYYSGSTAVRNIDDLVLNTTAPAVATPTFSPAAGEYSEAQNVTISCTTEGATIYYTTDGTDPTNESTQYSGAIAVDETTTIKAIAYVGTDASTVATAEYTIVEPLSQITIAAAREQATGEVLTAGTVTSVNGKTAYIQDETAAIVVYGNSNLSVAVGDAITVQGTLSDYYGLLEITSPEITVTTQGNEVAPEVTAIAAISNDNQAQLIKIENATVTAIDGRNVTVAQGDNNITVYFNSANDITFDVDNVITLTGNIGYHNGLQIANPRDIDVQGAKYYVVGFHNNWDNGTAVTENLELKRTADGTLKVSVELGGESDRGNFKIIKVENGETTAWYGHSANGAYWITTENHTGIALEEGDVANLHIDIYGTYDFTLDISGSQPTLTVDGDWPQPTYYLAGSFATSDAWADDMVEFESQGNLIYTLTKELEANTELKIVNETQDQWYSTNPAELTKENSSQGIQLSTENGSNMLIAPAGTYTFTLDANTMTLTVTGWPIVLDGNAFVKVTSTDELEDGYYLIVYEGHESVAFDGGLETDLDGTGNSINVTIAEKLIAATNATNAAVVTIKGEENGYSIQTNSGIYIGTNSNSNELKTNRSTPFIHAVTFDDEGNVLFTGSGGAVLRYNNASNQLRFRYYKSTSYSGQQPVALYKLTTVDEIPVTIGSTGYSTLYYSDKALAVPEGVTAKYVSAIEDDGSGKILFTEFEGMIPAGTGVVLQADPKAYTFLVIPDSEAEAPMNNLLSGTDEAATTVAPDWAAGRDCKFYMLSKKKGGDNSTVGFYYGSGCPNGEAFTNGAHKAYLTVPKMSGANARSFYLFSDAETTTGIDNVQSAKESTGNLKIYNLNGQRVSTPQRGIYIVNGKKVLVK